MIEFKGTYFKTKTTPPQSVLVQFDGVLLHVWHMSNPFHRILASDVFQVQNSMGKTRYFIKLPNGAKIETEDANALITLRSRCRTLQINDSQCILSQRYSPILLFGAITAISIFLITYWLYTS